MSSLVLATAGYDHSIRFWEATTGICYRTIPHQESQVNKLEISHDKVLLAAAGNPSIKVFDVPSHSNTPVNNFDSNGGNVTAIGFQKDKRWMFSGSEDKTVKLWDMRTNRSQREFESRAPVTTVALNPSHNELISGDQDGNIRVWDMAMGTCSCELVPELDVAVRSISIALDGSQVIAANNKGTCFIWRMIRGVGTTGAKGSTFFEPVQRIEAHPNQYILKCLISPDVRKLATTSSDRTIKIWNLDTFQCEKTLQGHVKWVWDAVFSVDAAYLVTASSDQTARLWDVGTGRDIRVYTGHSKAVVCCALNDNAVDDTH